MVKLMGWCSGSGRVVISDVKAKQQSSKKARPSSKAKQQGKTARQSSKAKQQGKAARRSSKVTETEVHESIS
jgi:hypothetical protein